MIFKDGFPKTNTATDYMDSAMLAGMMALFGYPGMTREKIFQYMVNGEGVRAPFDDGSGLRPDNPKNFTRDQLVCLVAGLYKMDLPVLCYQLRHGAESRFYRAQNTEADAPGTKKSFPNGADLLPPSVMNHLRICAGATPTWLGKMWLKAEIYFSAMFAPLEEPNQLMAMCMIAGPEYVKLLREKNHVLDIAIRDYWASKGESEFAEFLISSFK